VEGQVKAQIALLEEFNQPLAIRETDVPPLELGQVLVQVEAAGVCGSDVHMWRGKDPRTPRPIILGHEGVGRVVEVAGEKRDVDGVPLRPGERVLWNRGVTCGACYYCTVVKEPSLCTDRWVYGIYRSIHEPTFLNGCYATHIILDARTDIFHADEALDPAVLVPASCSGATTAHAFELTPVVVGDTVLIYGPGPVGAFAVAFAQSGGARHIIVSGGTPQRLALCEQLGATLTLNRHQTNAEARRGAVLDLTHGRGADLVVEASGSVAAMQEGLDCVRHGGALSLVGFATPVGDVTFPPFEKIVRKNLHLQGVWVSDTRHTRQAMALIESRPETFAALVSHRFPLAEVTAALETVARREAMKAVLIP
jgi:threonine dehydrogenase-like Zn-dependent dehydrogenase